MTVLDGAENRPIPGAWVTAPGRLEGDQEEFMIHVERGGAFTRDQGPAEGERYPRGKPLRDAKL